MMTTVSVLIPAYNAEAWVAETIESVLAQTWAQTEIIVVDDGSRDDTLAEARRYEADGVRVIAQPNRGASAARNTAFDASSGSYIQYLDADDLLAPDKLEIQLRRLAEEPPGTVAACAWARFYNDDPATADFAPYPDWRDYEPAAEWLVESWMGQGTMPPLVWLTPRSTIEAVGPWDETLSLNDDGEYFARVLAASPKIAFCSEARGYYRSGLAGSLSTRTDERALASFYRTCELGEQHLLSAMDTPEARRACAGLWDSFLHTAYPDVPELTRRAEARIKALGGSVRTLNVSRPFRPVRDLFGWKPALRLQRWYQRTRYE